MTEMLWILHRCRTVLSNMAHERTGADARWWLPRWYIPDEPLRNDAGFLVPEIDRVIARAEAVPSVAVEMLRVLEQINARANSTSNEKSHSECIRQFGIIALISRKP